MPDKYFEIGDTAILVHHRGDTTLPGSAPTMCKGQTVLFLHDAGANGNSFSAVMDELADSHSPISLDFPGHGRSGSLDSLSSITAFAEHAEALMRGWEVPSLVIVGEGLGAAVGLELAQRGHLEVSCLICIGEVGVTVDLADEIAELESITAGKARRNFNTSGYAPDPDESVLREAFAQWVKTDPRATLGARRAQHAWNESVDLKGLSTPTVVVVGEHADPSSVAASDSLAQTLSNSTVEVLAGAGIHGPIEQPEAFAALISRSAEEMKRS